MEGVSEAKLHRCPGCGVFLPHWRSVCGACAERNRREETEEWLLERADAWELRDETPAEGPAGRAQGRRKTMGVGGHETG